MYKKKLTNINTIRGTKIYIFSKNKTLKKLNYDTDITLIHYKNFLNWLFKTFRTNEKKFRTELFNNIDLKKNQKILITGVGTGNDLYFLLKYKSQLNLKIYTQDLSLKFLLYSYKKFKNYKNVFFNLSDAKDLPFKDNVFDHTFHFGGINLFGNLKKSINEMFRVTKNLGSVNFGDEGIANWLRKTVYADMMINNNKLWKKKIPINLLPICSSNLKIRWLLGNCFYFINATKNTKFPEINLHIKHKSPQGGSIYSRYLKHKKIRNKKNLNNREYLTN